MERVLHWEMHATALVPCWPKNGNVLLWNEMVIVTWYVKLKSMNVPRHRLLRLNQAPDLLQAPVRGLTLTPLWLVTPTLIPFISRHMKLLKQLLV